MSIQKSHTLSLLPVLLGVGALLVGCAGPSTPELDAKFGDAVRASRERQTLTPTASVNKDPVLGIDGKAAVNAQERYQDSFKSPPKTFEILGIGGSVTGQ